MAVRTLGEVVRRAGDAVSVEDGCSVAEVARALMTHNVDAAAVLTQSGTLAGIVTSSDVTKTIGRGESWDINVTHAMTVHPTMLPPDETPANALQLMRQGGFRHLPVVDTSSGAVLGIVDVLHLTYDAILRLQASYAMVPTRRTFAFMRAARETIEKPTLRSFMSSTSFTSLLPDHSALDACEAIVKNHVAAVIVVDRIGNLEGIFTCRDVACRVVAAGRDPVKTALRDVMTPRPDFALPDFTIIECLQRMQACGFRHLPVLDDRTRKVIGLVDVLQLAADSLTEITDKQHAIRQTSTSAGKSGSREPTSGFSAFFSSLFSSGIPISSLSLPIAQYDYALPRRTHDDIDDSGKTLHRTSATLVPGGCRNLIPSGSRTVSTLSAVDLARIRGAGIRGLETDPGIKSATNEIVTFKFKDQSGEYRRLKVPRVASRGSFDQLILDVRLKYYNSSSSAATSSLKIKYVDEDGDDVLISGDDDLAACFAECSDLNMRTIKLKVFESQSRRSVNSEPSPVSSLAGSMSSSPKKELREPGLEEETDILAERTCRNSEVSCDQALPSVPVSVTSAQLSPSTIKATEAHALMMDQRIDEAIVKFNEAIALDTKNARAHAGRGAARLISGSPDLAEADYMASLAVLEEESSGPTDERTLEMCVLGLVEALISLRRYEDAATMSTKLDGKVAKAGCAEALRDELDVSSSAATNALDNGEYAEAMALFSNAIRVEAAYLAASDGRDYASGMLRSGRGTCYLKLKDFEMALEDFDAAAKLEPESIRAFKGMAKCYIEKGEQDHALRAFCRAAVLDPADEDVQREIATLRGHSSERHSHDSDSIAKLGAMLGGMSVPSRVKATNNAPHLSLDKNELPQELRPTTSGQSRGRDAENGKRKRKKTRSKS